MDEYQRQEWASMGDHMRMTRKIAISHKRIMRMSRDLLVYKIITDLPPSDRGNRHAFLNKFEALYGNCEKVTMRRMVLRAQVLLAYTTSLANLPPGT